MSHPPRRRARTFALLLGAGVWLCACTSREEQLAEHLARGEQHEADGDRPAAILEYSSALNLEPENAELYQRLGGLLARQGALENAARHYREAHRLDPGRVEAAMREAQIIGFRDRARADELVAAALERSPQAPIVHRTAAELALIDGRIGEALAAAMRALDLDREDAESWIELARVQRGRLTQFQLANQRGSDELFRATLGALERADRLMGGDVGVRLERAQVFGAWFDHGRQAMQAYLQAIALARQRGDEEGLAIAAHALNDFAKAAGSRELRLRALREIVEIDDGDLSAWQQLARLTAQEPGGSAEPVFRELLARRPRDPGAHRLYASHLIGEERSREALQHLERVLSEGVDAPLLWDDLIRIRLQKGQLAQAQEHFAGLSKQSPDHPLTRRAQARLLIAEGRFGKAARLLVPLSTGEDSAEALRLLAVAQHRRGKLKEAREAIDRAIEQTPGFSPTMVRLKARVHHDTGEWEACLAALSGLGDHGQTLLPVERLMRAQALYRLGRGEEGRALLEALLSEPEHLELAAVEYAREEGQRDPARARRELEAALAADAGSYPVLEALVRMDVAEGRSDRALERLNAEVGQGRSGPRILLLRAEVLTARGELAPAESDALRAFEAAPSQPRAADLLLAIYGAQGTLDEARRSFEEAEAAGVLHNGARLLLGRLYARQGDTARARQTFEKVLAEQPRLQEARIDLALLLARSSQDLDEALRLARGAGEALGSSPRAAFALGYVYYRKGLHEAALQQFEHTLELSPVAGDALAPTVHYHLGLALQALDRTEQAAAAFESALALSPDFPEADDARQRLKAGS